MQRMFNDPTAGVQFWTDELAEASQDTIKRLRHCFPGVAESDLAAMAARHPATAAQMRYCRRRLAYYRRQLRSAARHGRRR